MTRSTLAPTPVLLLLVAAIEATVGCGGATASEEVQTSSPATADDPLNAVTAEELFRRGVILGQRGDFVRAEQYLLAARRRNFDEDRVIPALMEVCVRASRLSAAIGYAEPYLESHPANWSLRMLLGSIHLGLGHLGDARQHLERALRDASAQAASRGEPEPAEPHYLLGIVLRDQAEIVLAREHFARYQALAPEGTHAEEVRAILDEPIPHQAHPIPPPVRPTTAPTRLPNASPLGGPSAPSPSAAATGGARTGATREGSDESGGPSW